jgi:hypothetical protein
MEPEMDEGRILAKIERRLTRDDPQLAARMDTLNQQFPEVPEAHEIHDTRETRDTHHGDDGERDRERRNWRKMTAVVLVIVALVGLILTAAFAERQAQTKPATPNGLAPSAVSLRVQRRDQLSRTPSGNADQPVWKQITDLAPRRHVMRPRDLVQP